MLTDRELRNKLEITPKRLSQLIKRGLPAAGRGKSRRFDPAKVADWLKGKGLAEETGAGERERGGERGGADRVATTIAEAAILLGVSTRVFADWLKDSTFPGKSGTPGRRDGYFPIEQIQTWHQATHGISARSSSSDAEAAASKKLKAQIQCDLEQLELERELATIADAAEIEKFLLRTISTVKAILGELPDKLLSRLPGKINRETRQKSRAAAVEVVGDALNAIAELIAGDQDETEDLPDDEEQKTATDQHG